MSDIFVTKQSEVFIKVVANDSITAEISDYFSFLSPGHNWSKAFRKGKWNGKTYLFNKGTYLLPAGLLRYLLTFAASRKYSIDFEPGIGMMNNFSIKEATDYLTYLNIWSQGKPLEQRDYQQIGLAKAIRYKRMLIVSPTASGKSYMMYAIGRYLLEHRLSKGLIIVPTVNLVNQLKSDFEDYAHETWDVSKNVHTIHAGSDKTINKPITISTWQSLANIEDRNFFAQFDFVIGDEAHNFKANSLKDIMLKLVNAHYRIATTGTLSDWKIHRLVIEGLFGPMSKLTTTKKMMDEGQIAGLEIKALILKHPVSICGIASEWKKKSYNKEIDYLVGSESRNNFAKNLTLSLNGNTLLLFQYIEKHGEILFELLKKSVKDNRKVFFVYGKTDAALREDIRCIVDYEETNAIIIASYGVFSQGVNIRNLHNVIFASPSKSKIRVLQSIGRGLRLSKTKTHMTLFDIADDLRINTYVNHTLKHFVERVKIYKSEMFKISNYHIELQ